MQTQLKKLLLIVSALAFSLSVSSCAARDHNGDWQGTTSQGLAIYFSVQNNTIAKANLEYVLKCDRSGVCPTDGTFDGNVGQQITGESFSAKLGQATLSGKFDSGTTASGEVKAEVESPQCGKCTASVTWTAKKQ